MMTAMLAALRAASILAAPVSVPDLVELTDISGLAASPDGRRVAFRTEEGSIADNDYRQAWYVVAVDDHTPPRRIADGGGALFTDAGLVAPQSPVWASGSDAIYVRALFAGAVQVWRVPVDGRASHAVTHDAANVRDFALGAGGATLTYHVGATRAEIEVAEQQAHDGGVLVDKSVDLGQPISRGAWIDGALASQRFTGHWFARGDMLWQRPLRAVTIGLPPDADGPAGTSGPLASATGAGPTSPGAIAITPSGATQALVVDSAGHGPVSCTTVQCRSGRVVSAIPLFGRPDTLLVTTSDPAHAQTLSLWTIGAPHARSLVRAAGLLNGGRDMASPCAVADDALVCVEADALSPPHLVRIDLRDGRHSLLFDPNAGLRARIAETARRLTWTSADGTMFTGTLILPKRPRPTNGYPLVLHYYSCSGFLRGGLGDELPMLPMLPLAARGIASLCINQPAYAGARDPARDYDRAVGGIIAVVADLGKDGLIDRRHIGMWGLSFGSEITMAVARRTQLLSAVSISTAPIEPAYYWYYSVRGNGIASDFAKTWHVGDPATDPASWVPHAPVMTSDQLHAPILMQVPEQEARIAMQFYSTMSRSSTPIELYAFANEPHIKEQPRHQFAAYTRNLDWFRFWLQGAIDPDPDKASQYLCWRDLAARRPLGGSLADHAGP